MFSEEIKRILIQIGWQSVLLPGELIEMWEGFVNECSSGYEMNIYEYENDLSVRNVIETILTSNELKVYPEYFNFKESIQTIDNSFKKLLSEKYSRNDRISWWEKGVLSKAGIEYTSDIKALYGIEIKHE
ncbi:MAG: hypothetical protein SFU87_10115 [Chitinophagaceae bacterium]|nr:hypothetical protein [Chitinophagaceae bacterium]